MQEQVDKVSRDRNVKNQKEMVDIKNTVIAMKNVFDVLSVEMT